MNSQESITTAGQRTHDVEIGTDDIGKNSIIVAEALLVQDESGKPVRYKLYRRRFYGIAALVILNMVAGMGGGWFGPIANNAAEDFSISLNQVNWLGNAGGIVFLPIAPLAPAIYAKFGIRTTCLGCTALLLVSSWIRFSGTIASLSSGSAFTLLLLGQIIGAVATAILQVLGPKFSETWFDLEGRTTATMLNAIANPIGLAVGSVVSPSAGTTRQSILVLAIISTAVVPVSLLVGSKPPTPPTFSGGQSSPPLLSTLRALIGREKPTSKAFMTVRQRIDFTISITVFSTLSAVTNTFANLSGEIFVPYGYSDTTAGLIPSVLIGAGILSAIITAPLVDRIFTNRLAIMSKTFAPMVALAWLSLVWAVRPHNAAPLYVISAVIGIGSVTMLPVGLELGCELTRNADGSSAITWFFANLLGVIFILIGSALRAGPNANPPMNMHAVLLFNGVFACSAVAFIFLIEGKQTRRALDMQMAQEMQEALPLE